MLHRDQKINYAVFTTQFSVNQILHVTRIPEHKKTDSRFPSMFLMLHVAFKVSQKGYLGQMFFFNVLKYI